jgi:hypothetical protein
MMVLGASHRGWPGRPTPERGDMALARALFTRANDLTASTSCAAQGTQPQTDLHVAIEGALRDADTIC